MMSELRHRAHNFSSWLCACRPLSRTPYASALLDRLKDHTAASTRRTPLTLRVGTVHGGWASIDAFAPFTRFPRASTTGRTSSARNSSTSFTSPTTCPSPALPAPTSRRASVRWCNSAHWWQAPRRCSSTVVAPSTAMTMRTREVACELPAGGRSGRRERLPVPASPQ